nr:DNA-binding LytR/AlgR family response regulator [Mucilaginibacter sp. SP1R1]
MPALSGLEFAGLVNSYSTVIFTTAYREYALDAFEQQAMDYILKPISYERFLQSIEKIRAHLHVRHLPAPAVEPFFFVKGGAGNKFIRIDAADITHITAASNYIEIYLQEQKILTYMSLGEVAAKLPAAGFSRIHKSHIVNHHFIKSLTYGQLTLNDDMKLPIGRVYRKAFHQLLKSSFRGGKQNGRT